MTALLLACALASAGSAGSAGAQMAAAPAASAQKELAPGPLAREMAAKLVPATVFFAGQVASVQTRNTGGVKLPGGLVLAGIVDTSGYSTGVQQRYQAYLLLDTPAQFGGKLLEPGAYGCGMVNGQFLVLDLSAKTLFSVAAQHDATMTRPMPLQVAAEANGSSYRLYLGRNYVSFAPEKSGATQ